jgi:hypothetical protein
VNSAITFFRSRAWSAPSSWMIEPGLTSSSRSAFAFTCTEDAPRELIVRSASTARTSA